MKSASEWWKENQYEIGPTTIESIQRDALEAAAKVCFDRAASCGRDEDNSYEAGDADSAMVYGDANTTFRQAGDAILALIPIKTAEG